MRTKFQSHRSRFTRRRCGTDFFQQALRIACRGECSHHTIAAGLLAQAGGNSGDKPARNKTILSNHLLAKRVQIGYRGLPHAIDYQVTVTIPAGEHNTYCVIEALTGYMPSDFDKFWVYDTKTGELHPLDDGPGEQALPIVFSTEDGAFAMGAYSPGVDAVHDEVGPRYGRFKFMLEQVVKWNCVYRIKNASGLGGDYRYEVLLAVGTLEDVKSTLAGLMGIVKK